MPQIKANGINLYYEEEGKGETLILIPGFTQHSGKFKAHLKVLRQVFHTIVIDNRGSGQSSCPDKSYLIEDFAQDTAALMDALNIEKAHLLGNSMGTCIALQLCLDHPNKVNKVCLCAPSPKSMQ